PQYNIYPNHEQLKRRVMSFHHVLLIWLQRHAYLQRLLDLFLHDYASLQVTRLIIVCLACFSAARDDKEQWKWSGDDGRGICLGIPLLDEPSPMNHPAELIKVDYSESSWRDNLRKSFGKASSILSRAEDSPRSCELGLSAIYRIAAFASIRAKQAEWAAEQEFRHVTLVRKNAGIQLKERESAGSTIRYLPVSLRAQGKRIALDEIIIGSNRNAEDTREQLKRLLADKGYKVADSIEYPVITVSSIPPWDPTCTESRNPSPS
ncbi:MAG: hypothetical protein O6850_00415, partial [Acidobacteria bacterium]|nr:hypothetical protein [Acidobacteriota bacterium]